MENAEGNVLAEREPQLDLGALTSDDSVLGTILSVVYVTASPTFSGAVGGYTTLSTDVGDPTQQTATSVESSQQSSTSNAEDTFTNISAQASSQAQSSATPAEQSSTQASSSIMPASTSAVGTSAQSNGAKASSTFASVVVASTTSITSMASISQSSASQSFADGAASQSTASSGANVSKSSDSTGMSSGAKTGLAIGILLAVALVAAGALFLYWKKKKAVDGDENSLDEKSGFGNSGSPMAGGLFSERPSTGNTTTTAAVAPMLDLRPVSRMRFSQGNPLSTFNKPAGPTAAAGRSLTPLQAGSAHELEASSVNEKADNPFTDPINPFGDEQAAAVVAPVEAAPTLVPAPVPFPDIPAPLSVPGAAIAVGAAGIVGASAAMAAPGDHSPKLATVAAGPSAGQSASSNNVHRIQLDFKPSMEDELGLTAGQLVRMLHEYDDGWVSTLPLKIIEFC